LKDPININLRNFRRFFYFRYVIQLPWYIYFIVASILAGITVYFKHPTPFYLKLFPIFLFVTLIFEVITTWMTIHRGNNLSVYNIYFIFSFLFYLNFFRETVHNQIVKRIIIVLIISFILLSVINIIYFQKIDQWNSISYSIGCLLIIVLSFYYFFEIFQHPKATKLSSEPTFWISSGLLFYYSCSFPFLSPINFLKSMPKVLLLNLESIFNILIALLHILFIIAFLCRIKFRRPAQ